ncbi:hypothetical protein WG66_006125 [Moniliophthora roreri]|nr:hypothetical protein WG66_006125 [Moniliophthora roreri]
MERAHFTANKERPKKRPHVSRSIVFLKRQTLMGGWVSACVDNLGAASLVLARRVHMFKYLRIITTSIGWDEPNFAVPERVSSLFAPRANVQSTCYAAVGKTCISSTEPTSRA